MPLWWCSPIACVEESSLWPLQKFLRLLKRMGGTVRKFFGNCGMDVFKNALKSWEFLLLTKWRNLNILTPPRPGDCLKCSLNKPPDHLLYPGVPDKVEAEIMERIHPPHLGLERTLVHGYPYKPTAMAWDPVQRLLAIGTKEGDIRVLGRPGVDTTFTHECRRWAVM